MENDTIFSISLRRFVHIHSKLVANCDADLTDLVASMLLILISLPVSAPMIVLYRGVDEQLRWSELGEKVVVTPQASGVDIALRSLFSNQKEMKRAGRSLMAQPWITEDPGQDSVDVDVDVRNSVRDTMTETDRRWWEEQAWAFVRHSFPRGSVLDRRFQTDGPRFLVLLDHIGPDSSGCYINDVILTLLSASQLSSNWRSKFTERAKELLQDFPPSHLHLWAARMCLKSKESIFHAQKLYDEFSSDCASPRASAQLGRLCAALGQRLIRVNKLGEAVSQLRKWKPLHKPPSTLERIARLHVTLRLTKALRLSGALQNLKFDQVRNVLKLFADGLNEQSYLERQLVFETSDICLTSRPPKESQKILQSFCQKFKTSLNDTMLLRLRLAEALLSQGQYEQAESEYEKAKGHFRQSDHHQMEVIWAYHGLARVKHMQEKWEEALRRWRETEQLIQDYQWGPGAMSALIHLSSSHVLWKMGKFIECEGHRSAYEKMTGEGSMTYWIPPMYVWIKWLEDRPDWTGLAKL